MEKLGTRSIRVLSFCAFDRGAPSYNSLVLKVREQKAALLVALYVLRENGFDMPPKRQVLNLECARHGRLIRLRNLLTFPEHELQKRHDGDVDEIWANDIAWKRKDLFESGDVDKPERGKWRLTERGISKIEAKKQMWATFADPEKRKQLRQELTYCTDELIDWMVKIGTGEAIELRSAPMGGPPSHVAVEDSNV